MTSFDPQEHGPYKSWEHLHTLQPIGDGVLMRDRVRYRVPFQPLSRLYTQCSYALPSNEYLTIATALAAGCLVYRSTRFTTDGA